MATSAINFQSLLTLNTGLTRGECELEFRPPSNIAGKVCYVDIKAFALSWDDLYVTPQVHHSFLLRSSWAQIQGGSVESSTQKVNAPLAILNYSSQQSASLPVLVYIPDGPHQLRFTVQRMDGGVIGIATTDISMCILMSIVPANSRQPPLGA